MVKDPPPQSYYSQLQGFACASMSELSAKMEKEPSIEGLQLLIKGSANKDYLTQAINLLLANFRPKIEDFIRIREKLSNHTEAIARMTRYFALTRSTEGQKLLPQAGKQYVLHQLHPTGKLEIICHSDTVDEIIAAAKGVEPKDGLKNIFKLYNHLGEQVKLELP